MNKSKMNKKYTILETYQNKNNVCYCNDEIVDCDSKKNVHLK